MASDKRFEYSYTQGSLSAFNIIVDKETGVQYLFAKAGYAGGLTVLVDSGGKPILDPDYASNR